MANIPVLEMSLDSRFQLRTNLNNVVELDALEVAEHIRSLGPTDETGGLSNVTDPQFLKATLDYMVELGFSPTTSLLTVHEFVGKIFGLEDELVKKLLGDSNRQEG